MTWDTVYLGLAWIVCGIAAAGFMFAYAQDSYPALAQRNRRTDLGFALLLGVVVGPVALVVAFCLTGFGEHGWRLR